MVQQFNCYKVALHNQTHDQATIGAAVSTRFVQYRVAKRDKKYGKC